MGYCFGLLVSVNKINEILPLGSYTPHPYIYTLTPTFDTNYQVYPFNHSPPPFSGKKTYAFLIPS